MVTKADKLRQELAALKAGFEAGGRSRVDSDRMDAIRVELGKLARRRLMDRVRREILFDMNGHHGPA